MLSILPYERPGDRDSDRPFKSYPRVPVSVPSSHNLPNLYGHYSASAFVGRPSRGALDLSSMDLRHGMHMDGSHMGEQAIKPDMHMRGMYGGHQQVSQDYLGRPGPQPGMDTLVPQEPPQPPPAPSHSPTELSSVDHNGIKIPPKKRPHNVPDEQKDNAYWEKRKKNNESAKRSRDARRMKEEQIAMRVVYLEQENLQLRTEVSLLKGEIEKLRCMLYNS